MSRTLGLVAGLTVPAGIYYISVVHLQGTTNHISESLHQQSLRLKDPTKLEPIVLDPRSHDNLSARIRQGWNGGVENGVRYIQEADWEQLAQQVKRGASNLWSSGVSTVQPVLEDGKEKLSELSESTRDAALHAGEAVGSAIHDANVKGRELAHDANVKGRELAHDANVKGREFAHDVNVKGREVAHDINLKSHELAHEANMQAHRLAQAAEKERHRLAQVARDDAKEAQEILRRGEQEAKVKYAEMKSDVREKSEIAKEETIRQAKEAGSQLSSAGSIISSKMQGLKESASSLLNRSKDTVKEAAQQATDAAQQVERKVEQSSPAQQMRTTKEWIAAQARYDQMLAATDRAKDMQSKEIQQLLAGRRIGFSSVDDPTQAAKQAQAAEKHIMKKKEEEAAASAGLAAVVTKDTLVSPTTAPATNAPGEAEEMLQLQTSME